MKAARSLAPALVLGFMGLATRCSDTEARDVSRNAPNTSIEGSVDASLADFPSMAAIQVRPVGVENWAFFCSGVVLDSERILTSLHCISMSKTEYRVLVGCDNCSKFNKFPHSYKIKETLTFATNEKPSHDLAILRLGREIENFGRFAKAVMIADYDIDSNPHPARTVSAVGWGRSWYAGTSSSYTWFNGSETSRRLSNRMKMVGVRFASSSECEQAFEPARFDEQIICTTDDSGRYMSSVDLGGPLFHGLGQEQQLVGLPRYPNANPFVFLDVTRFKGAIEDCKGPGIDCRAVRGPI